VQLKRSESRGAVHHSARGSLHYKRTGSLADVAELLGDSQRVAREHYVYALTDYREADRSIALARVAPAATSAGRLGRLSSCPEAPERHTTTCRNAPRPDTNTHDQPAPTAITAAERAE
jgi:hypothetical protein